MLWPRPRSLSAMCPPCVRLTALWPRLQTLSAYVRHVTTLRRPCVRHVPALCPPPVHFGRASKLCPPCVWLLWLLCLRPPCVRLGPACALASGLCPLVACCGAGPWHHEVYIAFFLSIAQPVAFILHACWSVSLAFILAVKLGLCKRTLCLKICLGSMLAYFFKKDIWSFLPLDPLKTSRKIQRAELAESWARWGVCIDIRATNQLVQHLHWSSSRSQRSGTWRSTFCSRLFQVAFYVNFLQDVARSLISLAFVLELIRFMQQDIQSKERRRSWTAKRKRSKRTDEKQSNAKFQRVYIQNQSFFISN